MFVCYRTLLRLLKVHIQRWIIFPHGILPHRIVLVYNFTLERVFHRQGVFIELFVLFDGQLEALASGETGSRTVSNVVVEEFELVEKELVVYAGHVAEFCRRRRRLFLLACFFCQRKERREGEDEETFSVSRRGERRTSIEEEEEEEESKESSSDSVNVRNHAILSY